MNPKIPLFKIYWEERDIELVRRVIQRGLSWANGPDVEILENKIAAYIGTKYAVTFNSGTSALHAVLLAYGIGKGNEVIVPSFTFIATANAPLFVGAKPVFADIEEKTYGLAPDDVEAKITKKTKAILPIHYGGCPCSIVELKAIARKHGLILIEDAAEACGAALDGKKVGTFGDAAILSFCQNKIVTTGEGGAVVTDSKIIRNKLKLIRSHGRLEGADYFTSSENSDYTSLGYNFRMSSIAAALGIAQMEKIDKIIQMRKRNAFYMNQKLACLRDIYIPNPPSEFQHVYQMYTIRLGNSRLRESMMKYLAGKDILTKVYFPPVHLSKFYRRLFGFAGGELTRTEKIASEVLTLPMYPTLTEKEMDYVAEQIGQFLSKGE